MDSSGNLYGTTYGGQRGTVFELAKGSGTITTLASCYHAGTARLIMDSSGNLYGTESVGAPGCRHGFRAGQGQWHDHHAGFVQRHQRGKSVCRSGHGRKRQSLWHNVSWGTSGDGAVFELAHGSGTIALLASFNTLYGGSDAGLIMDANGNLYGTTIRGRRRQPGHRFRDPHPGDDDRRRRLPGSRPQRALAGTFTVTAKNADGTTDTAYTGTVHFTSSDGQAGLPANYTFTAADVGVHMFNATMKTAGTQSLTAADTVSGSIIGGQAGIVVKPAAAIQLIIGGLPNVTHGVAFTFTVSMVDAYGNIATGYVGTVHFRSSDSNT